MLRLFPPVLAPWAVAALALALLAPPVPGQEPQPGLPENLATYRQARRQLLAADRAERFDAALTLDEAEQRLDARLRQLRRGLTDFYRASQRFPPAEPFAGIRDEIRATDLYRFLRAMPKGGVLHVHTSSTAPVDWILSEGLREPHCYVCWPRDQGSALAGQLGFFRPDRVPPGYQPARDLLAQDPGFPAKLRPLLTLTPDDARLTSPALWTKFEQIFQRVGGLPAYEPLFKKYYRAACRTFLDDQVHYVELRAGMGGLYNLDGPAGDLQRATRMFREVRDELRRTWPDFDLKLICSAHRGASRKDVWASVRQAVALRKAWAADNFVLGFDLVGQEDAGHATAYFLPDFVQLRRLLAEEHTDLPLYFHDGESDWPEDENLVDAYLLGSRRVGHGFNLFRFPAVERRMKQHGVAVELCPISNQSLGYVRDLRTHPGLGYLERGVPCVLGNDDPGILGNDGLSYDFWEATLAWDLDLRALKQLALNSLTYSGMTPREKATARAAWEKAWRAWVAAAAPPAP